MILNNYIIANLQCRITVCYPAFISVYCQLFYINVVLQHLGYFIPHFSWLFNKNYLNIDKNGINVEIS